MEDEAIPGMVEEVQRDAVESLRNRRNTLDLPLVTVRWGSNRRIDLT